MLPDRNMSPVLRAQYNAEAAFEIEHIRDFLILHYCATQRRDSEFWKYCAAMPIPDELRQKIELFREAGRFYRNADEMFGLVSWVQVMIGQGVLPVGYHPLVDAVGDADLTAMAEGVRQVIASCVVAMPTHEQFIDRYCRAPVAA
jgi:tryptophan 7-halogenase